MSSDYTEVQPDNGCREHLLTADGKYLICDRGRGHELPRKKHHTGRIKHDPPLELPGFPHRAIRHDGEFTWW